MDELLIMSKNVKKKSYIQYGVEFHKNCIDFPMSIWREKFQVYEDDCRLDKNFITNINKIHDAICDIEIHDPDDRISLIALDIDKGRLKSRKINNKWNIEKWFTSTNPLLLRYMINSTDLLTFITKKPGAPIVIKWKSLIYPDGYIENKIPNDIGFIRQYPGFIILYAEHYGYISHAIINAASL
jgi:hypothetical protein